MAGRLELIEASIALAARTLRAQPVLPTGLPVPLSGSARVHTVPDFPPIGL